MHRARDGSDGTAPALAMAQLRHGSHEGGNDGREAASRKPWLMLVLERKYPTLWFGHVQLCATLMVFFVALPGQSFFLGTLTPYLMAELGVSSETVSFYFFLAFSGAAVGWQRRQPILGKPQASQR